jgi:hypothetical protein
LVSQAGRQQVRRVQIPWFRRTAESRGGDGAFGGADGEGEPPWGYDRIVGALANLGQRLSDQTVGNILRRYGVPPAPKRKHTTSWKDFIRAHMDVLVGTDFFTVEVLTLKGLVTYYVLFLIQLESRRVCVAGITPHRTSSGWNRWGAT